MLTNELFNKEEGSEILVGGNRLESSKERLASGPFSSMRSPIVYIFFLKIQVGSYLN